jgi:hypothetical protein
MDCRRCGKASSPLFKGNGTRFLDLTALPISPENCIHAILCLNCYSEFKVLRDSYPRLAEYHNLILDLNIYISSNPKYTDNFTLEDPKDLYIKVLEIRREFRVLALRFLDPTVNPANLLGPTSAETATQLIINSHEQSNASSAGELISSVHGPGSASRAASAASCPSFSAERKGDGQGATVKRGQPRRKAQPQATSASEPQKVSRRRSKKR